MTAEGKTMINLGVELAPDDDFIEDMQAAGDKTEVIVEAFADKTETQQADAVYAYCEIKRRINDANRVAAKSLGIEAEFVDETEKWTVDARNALKAGGHVVRLAAEVTEGQTNMPSLGMFREILRQRQTEKRIVRSSSKPK